MKSNKAHMGVSIPGALFVSVDNQNYAYLVYASWGTPDTPSDIRISKVNIAYTVTNPLP